MDYRMNNIGSKIISNYDYSNLTKPTYPFPKPSITQRQYDPPSNYFSYPLQPPHPMFSPPIYNNSYMNQTRKRVYNSVLKEKIDELEDALLERQSMKKERTLLQVHSLGMLSKSNKSNTGDETSMEMLKIMNRQQDLLGDLARTVKMLGEKVQFPQSSIEYGMPLPKNYSQSTRNVGGEAKNKEDILRELDIESDDDPEIFKVDDGNFNSVPGSRRGVGSVGSFAKQKFIPHKLQGRKRFRALVWAILFPVFAFNLINKRKNHLKRDYISEMGSSISHFKKIASKWVLLHTKEPILSILKDASLDLDITGKDVWYSKGVPKALNTKIQKIHVRLKAFFTGLIEGTSREIIPKNLLFFFEKFINNGAFIPDDYFVPYEKARLNFDKFGALVKQDDEKKGMLLVFFLVSKILVAMFLMKPVENNLPIVKGGNVGM